MNPGCKQLQFNQEKKEAFPGKLRLDPLVNLPTSMFENSKLGFGQNFKKIDTFLLQNY